MLTLMQRAQALMLQVERRRINNMCWIIFIKLINILTNNGVLQLAVKSYAYPPQ
jgi:hypothetical protein